MQSVSNPVEGELWLTEPLRVNWGQDRQVRARSHGEAMMLPDDGAASETRLTGSVLSLVTQLCFWLLHV